MFRTLLAAVAGLALMTGAVFAQDSSYYNRRTETVTTPFGASQTTTTTTSHAQAPIDEDIDAEQAPPPPVAAAPPPPPPPAPAYDEQSADAGAPPPGDYDQTTTTRRIGPDGVETEQTDRYRQRQTFYDNDEELGARTMTTQTHSHATTYGPAPVYVPNTVAAGPSPDVDLPPYPRRTTTTTTTTTDDDGE